jgi:hypothetical protein
MVARFRFIAAFLALLGASTLLLGQTNAPNAAEQKLNDSRTWTDASGKFKIEAKFVKQEGDQVVLQRADQKTVKLSFDKLSTADQEFIKKNSGDNDPENPFKVDEEADNPFKPVAPAAKPAMPRKGDDVRQKVEEAFANPDDKLVKISPIKNAKGASELIIDAPASFSYSPDPTPTTHYVGVNRGFKLSQLPQLELGNDNFWDRVTNVVFDDAKQQALVCFLFAPPTKPKKTRIERLDLAKGESLGVYESPVGFVAVDFDPVTQLILGRSEHNYSRNNDRIDIWELSGEGLQHRLSFKPYDTGNVHTRQEVTWARFIGANHIGTLSGDNRFVLWETNSLKPVYAATLWAGCEPALSGQGKYLALITKDGAYVLETLSGKVVAKLSGQPGYYPKLSFRPDGKQLACASNDRVTVWDMTTGQLASEVYYPHPMSAEDVSWPAEGTVLLHANSNLRLIDLDKKVVLWTYIVGDPSFSFGGRIWSVLDPRDQNDKTLLHVQIPEEAAKAKQASLVGQDLIALKPGTAVGVFINVALGEPERVKIYNHILAQLKEAGITIDQNSPISIEAATEQGETESVTYHSYDRRFGPRHFPFGHPFRSDPGEKANVTKQVSRITIREKGNVLWEARQLIGAPYFITQKEGQSLQQAVNESTAPGVAYFLTLNLPRQLARHPKGGTYGTSTLTPQGLK